MCRDCREQNLERKRAQFDEPKVRPLKKGGYESKSRKVWLDRFKAARAWLKRDIEWYQRAHERGWKDSWSGQPLKRNDWIAKKYREARAQAKAHGALA